jgi:hypothetical protein
VKQQARKRERTLQEDVELWRLCGWYVRLYLARLRFGARP